jgi:hypothetical protein
VGRSSQKIVTSNKILTPEVFSGWALLRICAGFSFKHRKRQEKQLLQLHDPIGFSVQVRASTYVAVLRDFRDEVLEKMKFFQKTAD